MQSHLDQEIERQARARNWAAIVAMGRPYTVTYVIIAAVAMVGIVLGFISFMGDSSVGILFFLGLGLAIIGNGGMTLVANIRLSFKKKP